MERVLATNVLKHSSKKIRVRGWINNIRSLGKVHFLILKDRSGFLQVVIQDKEEFQKVSRLHPGTVVSIVGEAAPSNCEMGCEIINPIITVEVPIEEPPVIEYYKPKIPSDLEFILDHRPISLRNREIAAVFKIQGAIAHAFRLFMHDSIEAVEYFPPNLIGTSSEGGSEFFSVDYFGHTATLAQSSQLYKQIMVGVNERVFALAPFFRAEKSNTTRHLTEGKQLEFEMGFFEHWHEILDVQENCLKFIVKYIHTHHKQEIDLLGGSIIEAPENVPFPRLTFKEAQEVYFQRTGIDERHEPDLSPAAEKELCAYAKETFGTDLIFIIDWKSSKRPFYAYPKEEDPDLSNTFDLLCGGAEITSGGQRCHTLSAMLKGIHQKEMDPGAFEDYLSIFKQGMPPHGGFGMGLERLTMTLLKRKNIRETSLFPSDAKRIAGNKIKAHIFFGAENIRNEIIRLLKDGEIQYNHRIHESTPSSEDSAKARGTLLEDGIKAIILKGKTSKKNYQFNIPAHLKLDMKAVASLVGEKCEFENPEVIEERFGLSVGGVPPFGNLLNLDTFFDQGIDERETVAFNCGLPTESIIMKKKDFAQITEASWSLFTKN